MLQYPSSTQSTRERALKPAAERKNVYEMVTEKILSQLKAGVVPWHKPWTVGFRKPLNLRSGKEYRGVNVLLLSLAGYGSPYWLTFKQALDMGGSVKKGEKGTVAVFWKKFQISGEDEEKTRSIPLLRYFTAFNVEQCENLKVPAGESRNAGNPIGACDEIVAGYDKAPSVFHGGDKAFYSPLRDTINMPAKQAFESMETYYATLFHELSHSTGHKSRLARPGIVNFDTFGSHQYSLEELVAEMGAAFLAAQAGLHTTPKLLDESAAYIASWLEKLQGDPKMVVQAAAQAQKAADLILGTKFEEKSADEDQREAA
jgi:antirestriction protein ArdC